MTLFQLEPSANAPCTRTMFFTGALIAGADCVITATSKSTAASVFFMISLPLEVGFCEMLSPAVDIDDRLRKGFGCLLREVVADATGDRPMRVLAGKRLGVRARLR